MSDPVERELASMIDSVTCHDCGKVFRGWFAHVRAQLHQIVKHPKRTT